jgi:hypothetical protein
VGERTRYSKHFLVHHGEDFRFWGEREARILQALGRAGAPVTPAARWIAGASQAPRLVSDDAGPTVDLWSRLRATREDGSAAPDPVFAEPGHWWALARQSLVVLDAIHERRVVHLDFKADNLCIPWQSAGGQAGDETQNAPISLRFEKATLIDFAFSLSAEETAAPRATAHRAAGVRIPVAALAGSARGRPGAAAWPACSNSIGAATCSVSRRCSGSICRSSRTRCRTAGRSRRTRRPVRSFIGCWTSMVPNGPRTGPTGSWWRSPPTP